MGRNGPAFLAYPNFDVYLEWNKSLVYSTTAAYLATRLAGAPAVSAGGAASIRLASAEVKEVQRLLAAQGLRRRQGRRRHRRQTRAPPSRRMQIKFGLPADSYPDPRCCAG